MVEDTSKELLAAYKKLIWGKGMVPRVDNYSLSWPLVAICCLRDVFYVTERGTWVIITSPLPVVETGPYSIKTLDGAGNLVYVGAGKDGYHSLKETYRAVYAYATQSSAA